MKYYVNERAQANGDHEVHNQSCAFLPSMENRKYLGEFTSCKEAVREAKRSYSTADGCYFCSPECHKQ